MSRGAAGLVVLVVLAQLSAHAAAPACLPATPQPGPGTADPFRPPDPKATELNTAAKTLYRQGKWDEARAQYRAAATADGDFLAPRLNIACAFVRQERFREATAEVVALIERAYVPWAREVLEAADLGALKVRPEMAEIRRAMTAAAVRWGADLDDSLLFVARQRAPLRVPAEGAGVFILNPHQEVWAFSPHTARYRQLTADDGHVVALARAADGRRIAYVTAEKLVRGARPDDVALRGVALHELTLATMAAGSPARIDGDVRRLEIAAGGGGFVYRVDAGATSGLYAVTANGLLSPLPQRARHGPALAVLTGHGATARKQQPFGDPTCPSIAHETAGPAPTLTITGPGRKPTPLASGAGAGLSGLPIP